MGGGRRGVGKGMEDEGRRKKGEWEKGKGRTPNVC